MACAIAEDDRDVDFEFRREHAGLVQDHLDHVTLAQIRTTTAEADRRHGEQRAGAIV